MARNILLTSLSAAQSQLPVQYYSLQKEYGFDYCDVLLDAEAGIKSMLARFDIDEVIVFGGPNSYDENDDLSAVSLKQGSALYAEDKASLSTYRLLRYRLAQFANEQDLEKKAEEELLPEDVREKLVRFIQDFQERNEDLRAQNPNRLFDVLSQNEDLHDAFWDSLFDTFPELRAQNDFVIRWVKNHLYGALKASSRLELLPVNEKTTIRLIPQELLEEKGRVSSNMINLEKSIVANYTDIHLYVALNSYDAADTFLVINMLELLVSMPNSGVRLGKIFTLRSLQRNMAGIVRDGTESFGSAELFHAIHAFLNYGQADMIVNLWERSGAESDLIDGMIYALRHMDVGLSMCNIPEVHNSIIRLRELFRDEKFWQETMDYGMAFSIIAESIREDYGALLEGDGDIPFIDLVKWAYRHQFYQQSLTLIESEAPDNIVKKGVFYYCSDEQQKEAVTNLFAEQRLELRPYEYYKMDEIDHYFIKNYNRVGTKGMRDRGEDPQRNYAILRTRSLENTNEGLITGYTACDNKDTLQNLLFSYYHLCVVRNKISHADADALAETRLSVSESDKPSALIWMTECIEYFIDCYEKAMEEVKGKNPNIIRISGDEVRSAAGRLKRQMEKKRDRERDKDQDKDSDEPNRSDDKD